MTINTIKVRPTVTNGGMVFNPNSIVEPSSCTPLLWAQDIAAIVIRGNLEGIHHTLDNLKNDPKCCIQIPRDHFSLFSWYEEDPYATGGRSFNLELQMGFGYLVTTDEVGSEFYIGSRGIAEGILRHAVDQIKGYLLGEVNEVADALNTLYEQLKSEAPEEKQDGELVFVLSYDRNNPMFNGPSFTYASGEVKEDQCPEGVKFIDDGHGGLHGVNIAFRNILA